MTQSGHEPGRNPAVRGSSGASCVLSLGNAGGSRLYGADNADALRGIYLDGIVLDEYADMDPQMWSEIIRPALADRGGWAVFIGTPKGRNAFFELWPRAQSQADWFTLMRRRT